MIGELIGTWLELGRINVDFAKLRVSSLARDQFRRGFDEGYRRGRTDEREGAPDLIDGRGMSGHTQVEIDGIEVDEGMRDLLVALWKLGIDTQFSCQGDSDCFVPHHPAARNHAAHIVFADIQIAYRFMVKTIELLGPAAFDEDGIHLTSMERLSEDTPTRASVSFSPALLSQITELWTQYETVVPPAASL